MAKDEKKEVKEEGKYKVQEVATASEPRISDGEKVYTLEESMVLLLNKLDNIEKNVVG